MDRTAMTRLKVSAQAVDDALYDAFGQRQVSTMYRALNQYHVVMEVSPQFAQSPSDLRYVYVRPPAGVPVPLSTFVQQSADTTPLSVAHQGQYPAATISFNLAPGVSLGQAVDDIQQAERDMGVPASIHGSFAGTAQAYQASRANMPILIIAALVAVY